MLSQIGPQTDRTRLPSLVRANRFPPRAGGGARAGAGRKTGVPNEKTRVLRAAGDKAIAQMKEPFEGDGYALLAMVYKDKDQPLSVRLSAAGMAMPYERPRLSQVDMTHRYGVDRDAGLGWARHGWA
jgi:hypothetical protein